MKMFVDKIDYLDESVGEAFITFRSNEMLLERCYVYKSLPLKMKENDSVFVSELFCTGSINDIYISGSKKEYIKYDVDSGIYTVCCKLMDKNNNIGVLNDIKIHIDGYLPGDSKNGDYIMCDVLKISFNDDL